MGIYKKCIGLCIVSCIIIGFIFRNNIRSFFNQPICKGCNVILVSLDTLGSNHLPCYGYEKNTAPGLCKFAKDNILFTQSYSNAPWTLPSHFSIFTSLYPKHHGLENYSPITLDKQTPTLTQLLKNQGYNTVYIGPTDDPALPLNRGLERGFDTIIQNKDKQRIDTWKEGYQRLLENSKKGKSTFLSLHTYWAHMPYLFGDLVSPDRRRLFTDETIPQIPLTREKINAFTQELYEFILRSGDKKMIDIFKRAKDFSQAQTIFNSLSLQDQQSATSTYYMTNLKKNSATMSYARSLYDEEIFYLDRQISELFSLLAKKELANNTIVIITSDHGEGFMEHGDFGHSQDDLYNNITSVPLIMYIPGIKKRTVTDMVQSIDLMPTILNMIGVKKPKVLDGLDLTDLIINQPLAKSNPYLISEGYRIDSIRDAHWKLYVKYLGADNEERFSLYNLIKDPLEQYDIASQYKNIVENLSTSLERVIYKKSLPTKK